jgi:hypothetical protein
MPCPTCNDTGWTGWEKPMSDGRRGIRMVFVPQVCVCKAGDACGAWIDMRDLGQVFEHEGPLPHSPQDQEQ